MKRRGRPDVYLATCAELPDGDPDTRRLSEHLREEGLLIETVVWSDRSVDWSLAPLTVIRSTWDYHLRRDDFVAWAKSVPGLQNPAGLVEWNTDKRYLLSLPASTPHVPSRVLEDPTPGDVGQTLRDLGWETAVLKPAVGLDGHGVERVSSHSLPKERRPGTWILQPFIADVAVKGEVSVVLIEGVPSHAVRRRPPADDFRSQERLGGSVEPCDPPEAFSTLARNAVDELDETPLYARVDLVEWGGTPLLMELELVEPSLFFEYGAEGLRMMGEAVRARLGRRAEAERRN